MPTTENNTATGPAAAMAQESHSAPVFDGGKVPDPRDGVSLAADGRERTNVWFDGAGLGLFIHYDHATQQGLETSWPLLRAESAIVGHSTPTVADYHRSAASFDPAAWDPPWQRSLPAPGPVRRSSPRGTTAAGPPGPQP